MRAALSGAKQLPRDIGLSHNTQEVRTMRYYLHPVQLIPVALAAIAEIPDDLPSRMLGAVLVTVAGIIVPMLAESSRDIGEGD